MVDTSIGTSRSRRTGGARRQASEAAVFDEPTDDDSKLSKLVVLLVIAWVLPSIFYVGPLKLTLYKAILLIMFVPLVIKWAARKGGAPKGVDFLIFGFSVWTFISIMVIHGFDRWETAGITTVETIGAYLFARIYIRTPEHYRSFIKVVCYAILAMLPFAFVEAATGRILVNEIMGLFTGVNADLQHEMRFGLHRVQGPFEHPILFGVFCATMTAPAFLIWSYGMTSARRTARIGVVCLATFLSLSMGAYISVVGQIALFTWDYVLRKISGRWLILFAIFVAIYIVLDILADRSPIEVFIAYLSFNSGASWNRLLIWEYGSAEVMRHPLFGIGFNDWVRPHWMVPSVDNFWLLMAMTYGLPGFILLISAFIRSIVATGTLDFSRSEMMRDYRLGYLVAIGGLMLSLCTVHVWNATYVFSLFFLGAGVWMRDYVVPEEDAPDTQSLESEEEEAPRYYSPRQKPREKTPREPRPAARPSRYTRGRRS